MFIHHQVKPRTAFSTDHSPAVYLLFTCQSIATMKHRTLLNPWLTCLFLALMVAAGNSKW